MLTVSRHHYGAQATCTGARPGAESRAKVYGGILESWESRTVPAVNRRKRMTPAYQRPGAWAELSAADVSEVSGATRNSRARGTEARGMTDVAVVVVS